MGTKLASYFDQAKEAGGLPAAVRLAVLARMSSVDAKTSPDSAELVDFVSKHLSFVLDEFGGKQDVQNPIQQSEPDSTAIRKLRNFMQIFADISSTQSIYKEDVEKTAGRITAALADALEVSRASIWLYNLDETAIVCLDLYDSSTNKHSSGTEIRKPDFPAYFEMIATSRTLSAEDAHTHPGTSELSKDYLTPLGINSMLDVPIFANGRMKGVVCHEHTGPKRKWTGDEENFAYIMGNLIGLSIERSR